MVVTIRDIARRAGVAVSTVSYVMNNTKHVKPETRDRVIAAVEELEFKPRSAAVALKTKKTLTIGIIIPEIANPFFTEIIRGVEETTYANGYNIVLCCTQESEEKEKKYLDDLISKDIDGLIFISTGKNKNILKNYKNLPIVVVDRKVGDFTSTIYVDNIKGGYMATEYLIKKNKKSVHLLTGSLKISTYHDRATGYMQAVRDYGYGYDESLVHECNMTMECGLELMDKILSEGAKIRSLFASTDMLALGALKAFIKHGVQVGKDVLMVGYDDVTVAQMVTPALTTIRQPQYDMGITAAELIIKQIKDKTQIETIIIEPKLIIRETA